jgi:UDP-3-O-[3-hydroxymyristoyl] glucosamine N-acyltransferase
MKLSELGEQTGCVVEGDGDLEISGAAGLDEAASGHVTFLSNPRYTPRVKTTRASAIYVGEAVEVDRNDLAVLRAKDPYLAYTRALILFNPEPGLKASIHPSAVIDETATVAAGVSIGAHVVIGARAEIGNRVRIHANVTIYENAKVGADSVLHSGVFITTSCRLRRFRLREGRTKALAEDSANWSRGY